MSTAIINQGSNSICANETHY